MTDKAPDLDISGYVELADINPDDCEIEDWERELGLHEEDFAKVIEEDIDMQDLSEEHDSKLEVNTEAELPAQESKDAISKVPEEPATSTTAPSQPAAIRASSSKPVDADDSSSLSNERVSNTPKDAAEGKQAPETNQMTAGGATAQQPSSVASRPATSAKTGTNASNYAGSNGQQHRGHTGWSNYQKRSRGMNALYPMYPVGTFPIQQHVVNMLAHQMMPMEGMYGYPNMPMGFGGRFPNRIHINPKFAGRQGVPPVPQVPQVPQNSAVNPEADEELHRQREAILETQRQRRHERKRQSVDQDSAVPSSSSGAGKKRSLGTEDADKERDDKRLNTAGSPTTTSKGITIKGAAAAARAVQDATSSPPQPSPSTASSQRSVFTRLRGKVAAPNGQGTFQIAGLASTTGGTKRGASEIQEPSAASERPVKRHNPLRRQKADISALLSQSYEPLDASTQSFGQKSDDKLSTLIVGNLADDVTEGDLQTMVQSIGGAITDISFDHSTKKATVTFKSGDSAVIFRRKYNRSPLKGTHITINFA